MRLKSYLSEDAGEEAKAKGLQSIGWGRYVRPEKPDVVVAISKQGRLVAVTPHDAKEKKQDSEGKPQAAGTQDSDGDGQPELKSTEPPTWGNKSNTEPPEEKDFDGGSKEWIEAHKFQTANGSLIFGTPHISEKGSPEFVKNTLIPQILATAEEAIKNGKSVVFQAEGEARGDDYGEDNDEQDMIAIALKKKFGDKVKQDTWDDNTSPYDHSAAESGGKSKVNPNSEMFQTLMKKFDDESLVDAALAAMDAGQGSAMEFSPSAKKKLESLGVKTDNEKALYKLTFPADSGDEPNDISRVVDTYNQFRRNRMLEKGAEVEKAGGITIAAPGASHAFSLKHKGT